MQWDLAGWLVVATLLVSGCSAQPAAEQPASKVEPATAASSSPAVAKVVDKSREKVSSNASETLKDVWEVIFMQDAKVGHGHTTVRQVEHEGESAIETVNVTEMTLARSGQSITQTLTIRSVQSLAGKPLEFLTKVASGPASALTKGRFEEGKLVLETTTTGKTVSATLAWQDDWSGFFAVEQSLESSPMQPGEERLVKELQPIYTQVADVRLRAIEPEETELRGETKRLLRIEASMNLAGTPIESVFWTDEQGRMLKMSIPSQQQTVYRTTREDALQETSPYEFDINDATLVRLNERIPRPHQTTKLSYQVTLRDADPMEVFASGSTQSLRRIDSHVAEITVVAASTDDPPLASETPPTDDDLAPNNQIQSDDARIVEMSRQVAAEETDPVVIAQALEQLVHESIREKNFSQAFATAADVVESREGDCTEHAVLLAALCRARNIPARVAIGLVYAEIGNQPGFAYHMWTEVWTGERWLPLDATLGRGGTGAAHLKLTSSNLRGANSYTAFLPVFRVMGQLQLSVMESE